MLKNKLYFTILICFVFRSNLLLAQEQIFPLNNNPVLLHFKPEKKVSSFTLKSTNAFGDTLLLPFVDDFSYPGPYPSGKNWLDSNVFINNTMGAKPPTWGVATFDGLNKNGSPYNPNVTTAYGVADTLTSKPIFLDYPAADSIYLSFYYQPQGYGNNPQPGDSLVLEFKDSSGKWRSIWSAKGSVIPGDSLFKKILIPITSLQYLRKGFQFRFKNYATLSGNLDHWHIDYIDIRRFRTYTDLNSDDVAFVSTTQNFLKDYKAVPYKHYTTALMNNSIKNEIVNLHSTVKNTSYKYTVHDKDGNLIYDYDGGNINIEPFSTNGIHNYAPHAAPPANFSFPENGKCSEYIISHVVRAVPDVNRNNDTLRVKVQLTDYFAYDDGTAEAAYGITQTDGLVAYKFEVTTPDTLNGVWIYFNPYIDNVSLSNFNLAAWNSTEDETPNQPIAANTLFSNPTNNGFINGYWYYAFEAPVVVNGVFFVGFKQQTAQSLNIGVDKHTKVTDKMYFNIDGSWNPSQFNYAWMMRPSFGNCVGFPMKIKETENLSNTPIILYPNPAEKQFSFSNASDDIILQIELYNQLGQKAVTFDSPVAEQKIDISFLPAGIYTVNCIGKKNMQRTKLIIQ